MLDSIFIYWICNAIINTQRKLRLLQNIRMFSLYKHLLYAFVFAVIGEWMCLEGVAGFKEWVEISKWYLLIRRGMISKWEVLMVLTLEVDRANLEIARQIWC